MDTEDKTPNITALVALARENMMPLLDKQLHTESDQPYIIWPNPQKLQDAEALLARPTRKRGKITLQDPVSFIDYVKRHRDERTLVTGQANLTGGVFEAWLDHHEAGPEGRTGWSEHHAKLELEATPEWARWVSRSDTPMEQVAFAEFIEDNADDIVVPPGKSKEFPNSTQMLSVALTLQAKTDVKFASTVRLQSGAQQLTYEETIDASAGTRGKMEIPERFALALAPFIGTPKYAVTARLRYRLSAGKVTFSYKLERPHKIVEDAFNDIRERIQKGTTDQVLLGKAEPQRRQATLLNIG